MTFDVVYRAGLETIMVAAVTSLLSAVGVSAAVAAAAAPLLTGALVVGGLLAAQALMAPRGGAAPSHAGSAAIDPGAARGTFESAESPELRAVGRVRIGGLKAFGNTAGSNRYRMTLHCKGEIDGVEEIYFAGREVVADIDSGGSVSSWPWATPSGSYAHFLIKTGTGAEASWPWLLADFPEIWSADHRVRGIAHSLAVFNSPGFSSPKYLQLYQSGVPDVEVLIRAEKHVYDPRTSATSWTENGILNALHILLSYPEIKIEDIDLGFIASEADRADALIASRSGNVPRVRCSGVWSSETARGENMGKVLESIGAWIVPRDGGHKIGIKLIDDDPVVETSIAAADIVEMMWQSGPAGVERPNICRLRYYSPERNYDMGEVDLTGVAWARVQSEIDAYGEKALDINLLFCPNSGQAQRRARQIFTLARADSGVIKTNMAGISVWGCRIVEIEFPDDLGTYKCLIGAPRILDDQGLVEIPFVVWPTLVPWNPSVHEADPPEHIPDMAYGSPLLTPNQPVAATVVTYQVGGTVTRLRYTVPGDAAVAEAAYRTYTAGNPNPWQGMTEIVGAGGYTYASVAANLVGQRVDFRVRTWDAGDNGSSWSETLTVDPMAVNNAAPNPPSMTASWVLGPTGETLSVETTGPNSLNVAYATVSGPGAPTFNSMVPRGVYQNWTVAGGSFVAGAQTLSVVARSTNGTASSAAEVLADIDGTSSVMNPQPVQIAVSHARGSGAVNIEWFVPGGGGVTSVEFTGGGAPFSPVPVSGSGSGSWADAPTAGARTYTATAFAGLSPVGTASVTITI